MNIRIGAATLSLFAGLTVTASAQSLPAVQMNASNQPPACATPGRLLAYMRARNPRMRPEFDKITVEYMRHGRDLGVRWDYALFQMIVETATLKFNGDVSYKQNNFAGLGATGNRVKGERFANVSDGVRAHLQHLMLYAGMPIDNPIAERTRKVRQWRILDPWRSRFSRPITYGDVGARWAPNDKRYGRSIQSVARAFYDRYCNRPDPAAGASGTRHRWQHPNGAPDEACDAAQ